MNSRVSLVLLLLLTAFAGMCAHAQTQKVKTCWEYMLDATPGLSSDFGCVMKSASFQVSLLCSEDGILFKPNFQTYIGARRQYEYAFQAYGRYQLKNPGQEVSIEIQSELAKEMTLWNLISNRQTIENQLDVIRDLTKECRFP